MDGRCCQNKGAVLLNFCTEYPAPLPAEIPNGSPDGSRWNGEWRLCHANRVVAGRGSPGTAALRGSELTVPPSRCSPAATRRYATGGLDTQDGSPAPCLSVVRGKGGSSPGASPAAGRPAAIAGAGLHLGAARGRGAEPGWTRGGSSGPLPASRLGCECPSAGMGGLG